jgi:hypothetical protein
MNRQHRTVAAFVILPDAVALRASSPEAYADLAQVQLRRVAPSRLRVAMIAVETTRVSAS